MRTYVLRRTGFSLVELLIVVSIIGVLAAIASTNYARSRSRARDANTRSSVGEYAASIEQYHLAKGTYLITDSQGNGLGYNGQGWGRLTAVGTGGSNGYGTTSIAQSLQLQGFLTDTRLVAGKAQASDSLINPINPSTFKDYLLAVCDRTGAQAKLVNGVAVLPGEAFALYGILENPTPTESQVVLTKCGGPQSTNYWLTTALPSASGFIFNLGAGN